MEVDSMEFSEMSRSCQNCNNMVMPMPDGRCPRCLWPVDENVLPLLADNDAEAPLYHAASLARALGWVSLLVTFLFIMWVWMGSALGMRNLTGFVGLYVAIGLIGLGIAELVLAPFLRQYRTAAVTALLVVSGTQALLLSLAALASVLEPSACCVLVPGIWVLGADIVLIVRLPQCYAVIRARASLAARGFEPVMAKPDAGGAVPAELSNPAGETANGESGG
jgi:hypothetical protein